MPLAHTEGGLTASVQRGAKAVAESGGFRTYVVADRITRASCFVCKDAEDALALARWIEERVPALRAFLRDSDIPELSRYAVLREAKTHVVGPMCHVLWRFTTGDAVGPNMMTRNAYALNMAYVLPSAPVAIERAMLEANMGGDKKPSYEYFQSGPREDGDRRDDADGRGDPPRAAHDRRGSRGARLGRHARRGRVRHAVGRVHAGVGDRRDLRRDRPGHRAWSARARWRTAPAAASRAGCTWRSASPGSRSAPSAAARRSRPRANGSR